MKQHNYTPISYTPTAPRPEIADIQRALRLLPDDDDSPLSLCDSVRIEINDESVLCDEVIVYRRRIYQMQNQQRRVVLLKVDPMRGDVPRSTAQIVAECPWLLS